MLLGTKKPSEAIFELFRAMKPIDAEQADKLYSIYEEVETLEQEKKSHKEVVDKLEGNIENLEERLSEDEDFSSVLDAEVTASAHADEATDEIGVYKNHAEELEQQLNQIRNVLGYNVNKQLIHNNQMMQTHILSWYRMASEILERPDYSCETLETGDTADLFHKLLTSILKNVVINDQDDETVEDEAEEMVLSVEDQQEEPSLDE